MNDKNDFTTGPIFPKLIRFMFPVLGALVLQAMYGAVDLIVVGHFGSSTGISGVSTGSSVLNLVTFVITALLMSLTVLMGNYIGQKRADRIGPLLGGVIFCFVWIAAALAVILIVFARPIAVLMQAPAEAVDVTVSYIRICGAGIFFIIAYNMLSAVFRGIGDSSTPLLFVAIACAVNIVGDLLFVAVFHWNVAGAALATVLAQAVSVVLSLLIIRKNRLPFTLKRSDIRWNSEIPHFFKVGAPMALQELLTQISFLCLIAFINRLGLNASSGYGIANKLISFIMLIPSSLMQSEASFISQNVGAGREDRARRAMASGMAVGSVIGVFMVLLIFAKGDWMSTIFSSNPDYTAQSWDYLRGFSFEAIVTSFLFSFMGYFNGHEESLFVMLQSIAQTFLVRLPMAYLMSIQPNPSLTNIGLAAPTATCFGITINLVYYIHCQKKRKNRNGSGTKTPADPSGAETRSAEDQN